MTTVGTSDVALVKENDDGSAVYQFNFSPEAVTALTRLGILTAIEAGIGEAKKLEPEYNHKFTADIKKLAEKAGFAMWGKEKYKPAGAVVDWGCEYDEELVKFYHLVKEKYDN